MNQLVSNNTLQGVEHHIHNAREEASSSSDQAAVHDDEVPTSMSTVQTQRMQDLEERIIYLEKELIETRLQLACARDAEECLKLKVAKLSRNCNKVKNHSFSRDHEDWLLSPGEENRFAVVSTNDPFSLSSHSKKYTSEKKQVHKARKPSVKAAKTKLNPGSCSSGLDLLAMANLSQSAQYSQTNNGSMSSLLGLQRPPPRRRWLEEESSQPKLLCIRSQPTDEWSPRPRSIVAKY